ncbi:Thioredoxin-like fold domain-containing protein MRL7 homolog, chloroplastic [Linum perenne]
MRHRAAVATSTSSIVSLDFKLSRRRDAESRAGKSVKVNSLSQSSAAIDLLHQPTPVDLLHQHTAVDLIVCVNTHLRLYLLFLHCTLLLDGDTAPAQLYGRAPIRNPLSEAPRRPIPRPVQELVGRSPKKRMRKMKMTMNSVMKERVVDETLDSQLSDKDDEEDGDEDEEREDGFGIDWEKELDEGWVQEINYLEWESIAFHPSPLIVLVFERYNRATDNWKTLQELEKEAQVYWNAKDRLPPRTVKIDMNIVYLES